MDSDSDYDIAQVDLQAAIKTMDTHLMISGKKSEKQNKVLIDQNRRIIELLERIVELAIETQNT